MAVPERVKGFVGSLKEERGRLMGRLMSPLPASTFSGNLGQKVGLISKPRSARQVGRHEAEVMNWDYSY